MENFLTVPGVAQSLFHVMISIQEQSHAVMNCIGATSMRETAMTITTAMAIFNVEPKTVIGHQRLIVAPTLLMKEVNIFRHSDNQSHFIQFLILWAIVAKNGTF